MDEARYKSWWQLHLRVALGEALSKEEQHAYETGRAELEAGERAELHHNAAELRSLQARLRELTAHNQELAQQENFLRERAAQLEQQYLALTEERFGLEV